MPFDTLVIFSYVRRLALVALLAACSPPEAPLIPLPVLEAPAPVEVVTQGQELRDFLNEGRAQRVRARNVCADLRGMTDRQIMDTCYSGGTTTINADVRVRIR